ncbi:MAG: formylglycine-generating enzyme family protein [Vicinamibacterales bacterium]
MLRALACVTVFLSVACSRDSALASRAPAGAWMEPVTGMAFVLVPAGRFTMGSPASEAGREAQETPHDVVISRPFYLGKFEVTQAQWQAVMGSNPSWFPSEDRNVPVEQINWYEAQEFVERLTLQSPGSRFRLPTEAEWEYAARAGTSSAYSTGSTLTVEQANYDGRYEPGGTPEAFRGRPVAVGSFPPNAWGLHDMHGNVWEWCEDNHCPYASGPAVDPLIRCGSPLRVIRGGSWYFRADSARSALRYTHRPIDRGFSLGLRIVREPTPQS